MTKKVWFKLQSDCDELILIIQETVIAMGFDCKSVTVLREDIILLEYSSRQS